MEITVECSTESDLKEAAALLISQFDGETIFAFFGEMGAGKTTFIRYITEQLGSNDRVSSPTYGIINEYSLPGGNSIYHFDFYRINKLEEAIDIGTDDYLNSENMCFIEWPEKIDSILPAHFVKITILVEQELRIIRMEIVG